MNLKEHFTRIEVAEMLENLEKLIREDPQEYSFDKFSETVFLKNGGMIMDCLLGYFE